MNEREQFLKHHRENCNAGYNKDLPVVYRRRYINEDGERMEIRHHRCPVCEIEFVWEWLYDDNGEIVEGKASGS